LPIKTHRKKSQKGSKEQRQTNQNLCTNQNNQKRRMLKKFGQMPACAFVPFVAVTKKHKRE
jgi:hypothetical protein